ncbi:MAG: Fe-only nitrogenase accessory AnfO family protein [Solidesulfovibrio sp. DCME]|uniref:Fe-only nitrogenase accessory AnfO family protein n=1 Tax=Solidesulfovibrio sp. DCME TaxID=3447380 RepID=UPI003D14E7CE
MMEIAVHMGQDGKAGDVTEPGRVVVYRFEGQAWVAAREIALRVHLERGLVDIRRTAAEVRLFLGQCAIFLSGKLPSVFARALHNRGIQLWEYEAEPELLLDYVWEQVAQEKERVAQRNSIWPTPGDMGDGHYTVSLLGSQAKASGLTTKQVLEAFLEATPFKSLEVYCSHMPPWMEARCRSGGLTCSQEWVNADELRLVFRPAS